MALTDTELRKSKPAERASRSADGGRLSLLVRPRGIALATAISRQRRRKPNAAGKVSRGQSHPLLHGPRTSVRSPCTVPLFGLLRGHGGNGFVRPAPGPLLREAARSRSVHRFCISNLSIAVPSVPVIRVRWPDDCSKGCFEPTARISSFRQCGRH